MLVEYGGGEEVVGGQAALICLYVGFGEGVVGENGTGYVVGD